MSPVPEVRERVRRLLTDWRGEVEVGPDGALVVDLDGERVTIRVERDADRASVAFSTIVRSDVEQSEALFRSVAILDYRLGSLRLVEEFGGLWTATLHYSLLGDTLDPDELRHAVVTLATTAHDVRADLDRSIGPAPTQPKVGVAISPPTVAPVGATWFQGSITVPLPPDWFPKESFTILAPDGQANVIMSSEPLDPSIDVERYAAVQLGLLEKEFPEFREVGSGDVVLDGGILAKWRQFGWTPPDGRRVVQLQTYAVPVPGRGYTATGTSPESSWARFNDVLRYVVFHAVLRPRRQGTA